MTTFAETLQRFMWGKIGSQKLSNLTQIPKSSIDSWLQGHVRRPREWQPILAIAQVLRLTREEANTLLLAAGHRSIEELAERLESEHPDRHYLQPWLAAAPLQPSSRYQLRAAVGDFVGRTAEIRALEAALRSTGSTGGRAAISGVQGMGGIGKTELAYVVAHQMRDAFPDAQIVLLLYGSSASPLTAVQAIQTVIRAFTPDARLPEELPALERQYRSLLHGRRALILADDAADATQVRALLPPAGCALLITSRQHFALPGMQAVQLEQLGEDTAVALLRRLAPRLNAEEARVLAQLCGYLPLALRVSGSLLHTTPALSIADYLAGLTDERHRLDQLRDPDDPQLDVAATLAQSYTRLDAAEQAVFRQLGVLITDFTTDVARAVVAAPPAVDVIALLHSLLRRSLIMYDPDRGRWRLHDLVRDLARRELERSGDWDAAMWRYARVAVRIAQETQEQYLAGGEDILAALARFDIERPHIDAARRWAQRHAETPDGDQLLLVAALATRYIEDLRYDLRQQIIPLWEGVRTAAQRLGNLLEEGRALGYLGTAYATLGETHAAIGHYQQRLVIARAIGDRLGESNALGNLGVAYSHLGKLHTSITYYEQGLAIAREIGDRPREGVVLGNLGVGYMDLGELPKAQSYFEEQLAIAHEIGDRRSEANALANLGNSFLRMSDTARAIEGCEQALVIVQAIGDRRGEAYTLSYLARAQARQGDYTNAIRTFEQAVGFFQEVGDRSGEADCQWQFGLMLAQQGRREEAMPLLRAALAYEQEIGHAKAAEHAALVTQLEAGEEFPADLLRPASQRTVGADADTSPDVSQP